MEHILLIVALILPLAPALLFFYYRRRLAVAPAQTTRRMVYGLSGLNLLLALLLLGAGLVWLLAPEAAAAAGLRQTGEASSLTPIAAALAVGMGSLGAAYAVSTVGAAAVGAIAEKPEIFGRALIFVGLAEGCAIYGLIIAFIILR